MTFVRATAFDVSQAEVSLRQPDYGHLDQDPKLAALAYQIGPKSVITFPSGEQQLPGRG